MKKLISIVVPMYNEEPTLEILYEELNNVTWAMPEYAFEYVFVNDGSKDKTLTILKELAARDERVRYVSFSRNFGKEAALLAGLEVAKGDMVATMDSDLQDPPALLPEMVAYVESGEYDNAATRRVTRKGFLHGSDLRPSGLSTKTESVPLARRNGAFGSCFVIQ